MSTRFIPLAVLGLLSLPPIAAANEPPPMPAGVSLTVAIDSTTHLAGDPLLVKGILKNDGKEAVWLPNSFESEWAGVFIEVCPPGSKEFRRANAVNEGLRCGPPRRWELGPGKSMVCYSYLLEGGREGSAFSTKGKWQVRMSVKVHGSTVTSAPVVVSVVPRTEREQDALIESNETVSLCLSSWSYIGEDELEKALDCLRQLGSSDAARAITQAQLLRELHYATAAKGRAIARANLAKYRSKLDPIAKEMLDLLTADILLRRHEFDEAKTIIEKITDRSHRSDGLRSRLASKEK